MKIINKQRLDALRVVALNALNETHGYLNYNFDNLTILSSDDFDSITIDNIINKPGNFSIHSYLNYFWNEEVQPFHNKLNYQTQDGGNGKDVETKRSQEDQIIIKSFYRLYLSECIGKQILFNKRILTTRNSKVFCNGTEVSTFAHLSAIEISELKNSGFDFEKIRDHYYSQILENSNLDNINLSGNDFDIEKKEGENFTFKVNKSISEIQLYKFLKKELPDNVIFSIDVEKNNNVKFTVHCNNVEAFKEANKEKGKENKNNTIIRFFKAVFYYLFCCCCCISRRKFIDKLVNDIQNIQKSNSSYNNPNFDGSVKLPSAPQQSNYITITGIEKAKDFIIEAKVIERLEIDNLNGCVFLKIQINFNCDQDSIYNFIMKEFRVNKGDIKINNRNKTAIFDLFLKQNDRYANLDCGASILNEIKNGQNYKDTYEALNIGKILSPSAPSFS